LIKNNFLRTGIPLETQATQKDEEEIRPRKDVAKKNATPPRETAATHQPQFGHGIFSFPII
jgi:hypothetical protein